MNAFIRLLYSLLIAIATVTFVGVGIHSFYRAPESPRYPSTSETYIEYGKPGYTEQEAARKKTQDEYDKQYEAFRTKEKAYYRNVSYIALPVTAGLLAAGVLSLKRKHIVGEGIALGGIATSIYAITITSLADQRALRFVAVSLLLTGSILIAHRRFAGEK